MEETSEAAGDVYTVKRTAPERNRNEVLVEKSWKKLVKGRKRTGFCCRIRAGHYGGRLLGPRVQ